MAELTQCTRVLLADDHLILLQGLRAILQKEGLEVVGEATDGQAAVEMYDKLRPDVAVFDIGMPRLNGIDAAKEILKSHATAKIVVLTMHVEESYVLASLRAGISGYVLKSNAAWSLLEAVRAVGRDEIYLSPGISRTLVRDAAVPKDPLSSREREVLQLVVDGRNTKEIGNLLYISSKTADTHRRRIMQKLNIFTIAGLVRYAMRQGSMVEQDAGSTRSAGLVSPRVRSASAANQSG
jgi:DNA-binding NarL/FixJ family response regulator